MAGGTPASDSQKSLSITSSKRWVTVLLAPVSQPSDRHFTATETVCEDTEQATSQLPPGASYFLHHLIAISPQQRGVARCEGTEQATSQLPRCVIVLMTAISPHLIVKEVCDRGEGTEQATSLLPRGVIVLLITPSHRNRGGGDSVRGYRASDVATASRCHRPCPTNASVA